MTCWGCEGAAENPLSGRFVPNCIQCSARTIARAQEYQEAALAGAITPAYRSVLQRVFGADWQERHTDVRAWAERMNG